MNVAIRRRRQFLALALIIGLVAAACGGSSKKTASNAVVGADNSTSTTAGSSDTPTTAVTGDTTDTTGATSGSGSSSSGSSGTAAKKATSGATTKATTSGTKTAVKPQTSLTTLPIQTATTVAKITTARTGPFEQPDQFCVPNAPSLPGPRTAAATGVTTDSLNITQTYIDLDKLKAIGVTLDIADFQDISKVFWNEINKCGGINGRKVNLNFVPWNPVAPDATSTGAQAACLKATEDTKPLLITGQLSLPYGRCMAVDHKKITINPGTTADFKDSDGRLFFTGPADDTITIADATDLAASGVLKGKKVGIQTVNAANPPGFAESVKTTFSDVLKAKGVNVVVFDVMPCVGVVCTSGIPLSVQKMKDAGVDTLINGGLSVTTLAPYVSEMKKQSFKPTVWDMGLQGGLNDVNAVSFLNNAGADTAKFLAEAGWYGLAAAPIGTFRFGLPKQTAFADLCNDLYTKMTTTGASYKRVSDQTQLGKWNSVVGGCITVRNLARAIYNAGTDLNEQGLIDAMRDLPVLDQVEEGTQLFRNKVWFTGTDIKPPTAGTSVIHYPCDVPTGTTDKICWVPADNPPVYRQVIYS
jgi:hypothetical protein